MTKTTWYIYILECLDGSYYTGVTNNLEKRMKTHQSGKGSKYVKRKGFNHLITSSKCKDKSDACKKEYLIKQLPKHEKLKFLKNLSLNPII
ncbi:GIY-YIG nuclease family protein [Candidatus Woesearchaeota archaeon]|nr:GIY-YIG nuclease family protein [Candidatus Woesearchaeota archaeon]